MNIPTAQTALKQYFGYDNFRPMQSEIIQAVYDKKDSLVLMPTGGGKSMCFQIPAITMPGVCVVLSPLIALMKDQVEGLKGNGIAAAYLNSSLSYSDQQAVENDLINGKIQLLYVSPEKMVSQSFLPLLKSLSINLFAIDEAHCISSWGHDFRPEYTQLQFLKRQFPQIPIIALTATADKLTRQDIVKQLGLPNPEIFVASFDRPNLSLTVLPARKRIEVITDFIKRRPKEAGIIYCLSRRSTEEMSKKLIARGIPSGYYHAGLTSSERSRIQEDFINDKVNIICATVAFGMGIDKSNIRWVIHYNLPKNMEGYYQEIGRAGRDGAKADTLLFYSLGDIIMLREILTGNEGSSRENTKLKLSKLERIQQYAETLICRRKILLNYFGENLEEDCGNCDVCKNPPQQFDGTVIAQKALSAVYRLNQSVGIHMLADVLRGSKRAEIFQHGYHQIKTYGAGSDIKAQHWQHYIQQLISLGYLDIAYDNRNNLRLLEPSKAVLFEDKQVLLVSPMVQEVRKKQATRSKASIVRDELFDKLRELRRSLAQQKGIPPYLIFSDATLEEMVSKKPVTDEDMRNISGVGDRKLHLYGSQFSEAIKKYIVENSKGGTKIKGSTYVLTLDLYQKGLTPEAIAKERNVKPVTIYSHLAYLFEKGENIDMEKYVSKEEQERILKAIEVLEGDITALKPIYDQLNEEIAYHKIRLTIGIFKRNNKVTPEIEEF